MIRGLYRIVAFIDPGRIVARCRHGHCGKKRRIRIRDGSFIGSVTVAKAETTKSSILTDQNLCIRDSKSNGTMRRIQKILIGIPKSMRSVFHGLQRFTPFTEISIFGNQKAERKALPRTRGRSTACSRMSEHLIFRYNRVVRMLSTGFSSDFR